MLDRTAAASISRATCHLTISMPANLTPQYHKAESAYRRAQTADERVSCLEDMLRLVPKHKGTDKLQADLRKRLKETKSEQEAEAQSRKSARAGRSYRFPRQGAGQVILLGGPNAGKSRVLDALTNASPEVASFPFSTREPQPGMMAWEDVTVQLIDMPPVTDSHIDPYQVNLVRAADLLLLCLDGSCDDGVEDAAAVIEQLAARKTLCGDHTGFDEEDLGTVHVKTILAVTRGGNADAELRVALFQDLTGWAHTVAIVELDDAASREALRETIYQALDVVRVYTKRPGRPANQEAPFTVARNGTVEDLALLVHQDIAENLKFARIWGEHVSDGQSVGRDHVLADKDLVELHA